MPEAHLIEHLHVEVGFAGGLPASEAEERLAAFAQGPALRIIDELFDEACGPDEVWRIDELALDLGEVAADEMEAEWALRLRERLRDALADLRGPGTAGRGAGGAVVRGRPQAQLEALLFFLQHGRLPWHGRGDDPAALARSVLRHSAAAFAAALRAVGDRPSLLRRLAMQLDAESLHELVHALMPGEPAAAARLLGVVAQAARHGRTQDGHAALWEAVLEQALAHGAAPQPAAVQLLRAQLVAALEAGSAFSAASDPLLGVTHAWEPLLRDDRAWLKATLQRLGDAPALQQRIVRALPEALLPQVLGLWLASHLSSAVGEWIATVAAGTPASAQETGERRQALWQATLQHVLSGGGAQQFDAARYADSVRSHVAAASPQGASAPLRWFDRVAKAATSALAAAAAALRLPWRTPKAQASEPAVAERLPVGNAGLVLAAPYMPRLFAMLGLAGERAFASPQAAERAVMLLQFMVTGRSEAPEPALLLNKLLCGLDISTPVPREIEITEAERSAVEGLLQAVIQHWKALGRTSVAGLRETFLQRDGHLERQPEAWQLQVEPRAFDMLIDQLPWGYSTVRHPWMERVVHVDWR